MEQEAQKKSPAPSESTPPKSDLYAIRARREKTRREREPDIRDRRSYGEKQRDDRERRLIDLPKGDTKGQADQKQPLDMDAIKRKAQQHLKNRSQQRQERGEDPGEDFDI